MRWRWWRRNKPNGDAVRAAVAYADQQLHDAQQQTPPVDQAVRAAGELSRRTDRFTREIERAWRLRETP